MNNLINGTALAESILRTTAATVKKLHKRGLIPHLGIVLIGNNPASLVYVAKKKAAAERLGIRFSLYEFPATIALNKLLARMRSIQARQRLSGLIVQLPLPVHLPLPIILNAVKPNLDVDCLTNTLVGQLAMGTAPIEPPTAGAVMTIIRHLGIELPSTEVCLVGTGALVGKPLALMLMNARASITTINSATKNPTKKMKLADIIVSGVGRAKLVKGSMVKNGAIIIDAGIAFDEQGKVVGDVDLKSVARKARFVTPTPGGVGPLTVAILLKNTVTLCELAKQ